MLPFGRVVAGPDGGVLLGSSKGRPCQDERSEAVVGSLKVAFESAHDVEVSVQVVNVAVLPSSVVDDVLGHGDLGAVEHAWLVHVVPSVDVQGRSLVVVEHVLLGEVFASFRVEKVRVVRSSGPAPTFVIASVFGLDVKAEIGQVLVHPVAVVLLDVRVDDGDKLAADGCQVGDHFERRRELPVVPGEVLLGVGVLDVEPHHVLLKKKDF